ncbi:MAG: hypothetical protein IPK93_02660 [Solirubrobacterales bacterium]|nr:hypothetical protein [Solirubrobacterales bacterium]
MAGTEHAETLLTAYVAAHQAGDVDPVPFLDRVLAEEREVLVTLIDAYLVQAPGRVWDPTAFNGTPAQRMVEPLTLALAGVSGAWPVVLPSLRNRVRIKRRDLVEKLATGLGYPKTTGVVEEYYHAMEHGDLPAEGVSDKVLRVLGKLLGTDAESLRRDGALFLGGSFKVDHQVFARHPSFPPKLSADADVADSMGMLSDSDSSELSREDEAEIDRLFTEGNV